MPLVISAVYPDAQIQRCVIHMLRNSFKYVNYNDLKKFSSDFKAVYNAPNEASALSEPETFKEKWRRKYPYAISNWKDVSSFFQFSDDIRHIMYTTNRIIFRSNLKMSGIVTLCDNEDDRAALMPIQREVVEKELRKAEEAEAKKAKKGGKAAKAVDIEE